MNINVSLPQSTLLTFHRDGKVVLSIEAVYLDLLLVSSQKATHQTRMNEDDRLWWLPKFTAMVNSKYNLDLSDTEAWVIAHTCHKVSQQLKKTFESIQKSLQSLESTLSDSPPENSKDSTSPSTESEPNENLKSEYANNL
jgi:hypothetical protein